MFIPPHPPLSAHTHRRLGLAVLASTVLTGWSLTETQARGWLRFNGSSEYAVVPGPGTPNLADRSFTIEFWCRNEPGVTTGWGQSGTIVHASGASDLTIFRNRPSPTPGLPEDTASMEFAWDGNVIAAETEGTLGIWHHWAVTYDYDGTSGLGSRRVYRNGEEVASDVNVEPPGDSSSWTIGSDPGLNSPFRGLLDELRIWRIAVPGEQIRTRMSGPLSDEERTDVDLLAYYPMDELTDAGVGAPGTNDVADASGNGHDADTVGTPESGTWLPTQPSELVGTRTVVLDTLDGESLSNALATASEDEVLVVDLQVGGTLSLEGTLEIHQATIIQGPADGSLTLDGGDMHRAFVVADGATLLVRDLRIRRCRAVGTKGWNGDGGAAGMGGAVLVEAGGQFRAERVVFEENTAVGGDGGDRMILVEGILRVTAGGSGGWGAKQTSRQVAVDGDTSLDGTPGGAGGAPRPAEDPDGNAPDGKPAAKTRTGAAGYRFSGGEGGPSGGGGGGGAYEWQVPGRGGEGGKGSNGARGARGGYGGGGGAGGHGGGGGGGGDDWNTEQTPEHGVGGLGGTAGVGGRGGFGAGNGTAGRPGNQGSSGGHSGGGGDGGGKFRAIQDAAGASHGGGGAGLGGAIFVESRGSLRLNQVEFLRNHAQGGNRGGGGAERGRGLGGAVFLMPGSTMESYRSVSFLDNQNTGPDGTTPDAEFSDPVFGRGKTEAAAIRNGSHPDLDGSGLPLYYYDAAEAESTEPADAVFRYKWSIWAIDEGDTAAGPKPQFTIRTNTTAHVDPDPTLLFGPADLAAAEAARALAAERFAQDPSDEEFRELLFDITYDTAAVLGFIAEFRTSQAERDARLVDPVAQSSLDEQIDAYAGTDGILDRYREALTTFSPIFSNAVQMEAWTQDQPIRHFNPLTYVDTMELSVPPPLRPLPGSDTSSDGFRDVALYFDLLAGHGRASLRLANLYLSREGEGDRETGRIHAAAAVRFLLVQGQMVRHLVPETEIPPIVAEAISRWEEAINSLGHVQTRLVSDVNALGFSDDFLLLIGGPGAGESFDYLYDRVDADILGTASDEGTARYELAQALQRFDAYNGSRTQFEERRSNLLSAIDSRLMEIDPGVIDPENAELPGEIDDQLLRIDNAKNKIQLNRVAVDNLHEEIRIAIVENLQLKQNNTEIADIKIQFGEKQRALDRHIARIEATQKQADRAEKLVEPNPAKLVVNAGNLVYQGFAEKKKIELEDEKAELAAEETLRLVDKDNERLDIQLEAYIKRRLLDLKRIAVESLIAANTLRQELNRLAGVIAERDRLMNERGSLNAGLAGRYYGDPLHQLRASDAAGRADISFRRARLWMFILIQALEYKWNQTFHDTPPPDPQTGEKPPTVNGDEIWTVADLFASRNARDLRDLLGAIDDFDTARQLTFGSGINDGLNTYISFKHEILGLSGPDAQGAFRDHLVELRDQSEDGSFYGEIRIPFHTARVFTNDLSFFQGVVYQSGISTPFIKGVALDKINWVKVVIRGDFGGAFDPEFQQNKLSNTNLRYGGTTYIRNIRYGTQDPDRPDRVINELVTYETRNYDLTTGSFPPTLSEGWIDDTINALIFDTSRGDNPEMSTDDSFANHKFADRSVAATDWILSLIVDNGVTAPFPIGSIDDIFLLINHRNYDRTE